MVVAGFLQTILYQLLGTGRQQIVEWRNMAVGEVGAKVQVKYLILGTVINIDVQQGSRGADGWALAVSPRRGCTFPVSVGLHAPSRKRWNYDVLYFSRYSYMRDLQGSPLDHL